LFAVGDGTAAAIGNRTGVAVHVTGVRISGVRLGVPRIRLGVSGIALGVSGIGLGVSGIVVVALILSGDRSADQRSGRQSRSADANSVSRAVTVRIAPAMLISA
jgi:hypothetical protein